MGEKEELKLTLRFLGRTIVRVKLPFIEVEMEEEQFLSGTNEEFCFNHVAFYSLLGI